MLRYDVKALLRTSEDGLYIQAYETPKSLSIPMKIVEVIPNIADVYKVHLTNSQTFCVSVDQILLTNKGERTIFELMGGCSVSSKKTYTCIGPKGTTPKITEITKLDKNAVFEFVLENPDYYFEVGGILLKGRRIEGKTQG